MSDRLFLGLDVGGTSVKIGVFTDKGMLLYSMSYPTPPLINEDGYRVVVEGIAQTLEHEDVGVDTVAAIGLALPCPIPDDGEITLVANAQINLPELKEALAKAYPHSCLVLQNDANAAAMGELWKGSAQGCDSLVFITLGTGVGGGIVIDGKVASGTNGAAGEIGHICVNPHETAHCGCGRVGCLEQYASATGIVRAYERHCEKLGVAPRALRGPSDTLTVFEAFEAEEEPAILAVADMCKVLGFALANLSCTIDPSRFVLGGGVSGAFDLFADDLIAAFKHYALSCSAHTPILCAELGNNAGMYGAAYLGLVAFQQTR